MQKHPVSGRHVVGGVLEDRWQLMNCIAEYPSETLWYATDLLEGGPVFVRRSTSAPRTPRPSDLIAFRVLRTLPHPNLEIPVAWREANGVDYVVLPWLQGKSLADVLGTEGTLSCERTARMLVDAARGLAALHRLHLAHRHIAPDRLWYTGPAQSVLRVTGFIRFSTPAEAQHRMFLAPEQIVDDPASAATDVYALGVIAYRAISGTHFAVQSGLDPALAHLSISPPSLEERTHTSLARLIAWMLRKNPTERPSMAQVASIAMAVANDVPVDLPPHTPDVTYAPRSREAIRQFRALFASSDTVPNMRAVG
jgi:serine/threonine protein kinase